MTWQAVLPLIFHDKALRLWGALLVCALLLRPTSGMGALPPVQTVFVIVLENHAWSQIKGNPDAPFVNGTLLPLASYCEQYYNPPALHPSLANYLWLEAGTNFGILDDNDPSLDHQASTNHLVAMLQNAGITWKTYQEDITGTEVPLTEYYNYVPRHNPFVYFDDITGTNDPSYAYGIAHIRPYAELSTDLTSGLVARYNFITPNLCNDMHDSCPPLTNAVLQGDSWLASEVPKILGSSAYQSNGALFITWDESDVGDGPLGLILCSPLAKGGGYSNCTYYTHSSLVRTLQEIFSVGPWLSGAANAADLSDLFNCFRITGITLSPDRSIELEVAGATPGRANLVQASADLVRWTAIATNYPATNRFTAHDTTATNFTTRFYRLLQQ